jgi:hypothetical protein
VDLTDEDLEDRIFETAAGDVWGKNLHLVLGDLEVKLTPKQMKQLRAYLAGYQAGE